MEYNESNFIYLKKTSMEKYYDELVKAEYVCEHFPQIAKVIVRKVTELFLKDVAEKYNIEANISIRNLLNYIKLNSSLSLPEEIYNFIDVILMNGYDNVFLGARSKRASKHPIEILENIHKIFYWYLKKTEPHAFRLIKSIGFRAPSTIEYHEKEINKIKGDILLKDNQINNLRKRIIELGDKSNNVIVLNKIIIAIKEEKSHLEDAKILLTKKIEIQKKQVSNIEKDYKTYDKKFSKLKERCIENRELLLEKESQLVKAEIQMKELRALARELYEWDETISRMGQSLEEELKTIREAYEHSLNLTNHYEDILETMEFSYDVELQKILELQRKNIKMEISFEDSRFNENIIDYTRNMTEAKRKVIIFKEILNEKIKREIQYEPFYRGFLRLEKRELRIMYTLITSINTTSNIISKSKELLLKSKEDKFIGLINKNIEELKDVSDDEIRLVLYYKLIKLSNVSLGKIYNRKQFVQALDSMVDKAYEVLMPRKDFKGRDRKLEGIGLYYLEKVIFYLKDKAVNFQIGEELADKIYKRIMELKHNVDNLEKVKIYYDKLNLHNTSEGALKLSIKSEPFMFLHMMAELEDISSYKDIFTIIFEIVSLLRKRPLSKEHKEEALPASFSNENLMILLFLSSEDEIFSLKHQEELMPLLVMEIMSIDLMSDNEAVNLDSYNNILNLWKGKQQKYNDIFLEKEEWEKQLDSLIHDKQELEANDEKLLKDYQMLSDRYDNYKEEFKRIVMNSDKRILLPSYMKYYDLRSKKESAENNISESKSKFGTLKSIFSPEVWKEQANKIINESNMLEVEKKLIEEAKQKPYFKKEYSVFLQLDEQMKETNKLIDKNKENIKNKNLLIDNTKIKINELQRQLNHIKDLYLDIEEGYY